MEKLLGIESQKLFFAVLASGHACIVDYNGSNGSPPGSTATGRGLASQLMYEFGSFTCVRIQKNPPVLSGHLELLYDFLYASHTCVSAHSY